MRGLLTDGVKLGENEAEVHSNPQSRSKDWKERTRVASKVHVCEITMNIKIHEESVTLYIQTFSLS